MKTEFIKELNDISPFMADMREKLKAKHFKVPDNYFEQLADKVIEQAKEKHTGDKLSYIRTPNSQSYFTKTIKFLSVNFRPLQAVAATFLLLAGSWWAFHTVSTNKAPIHSLGLSGVRKDVLNAFVSENIEDYDENILVENGTLTAEDLNLHTLNLQDHKADTDMKNYLRDNYDAPDEDL